MNVKIDKIKVNADTHALEALVFDHAGRIYDEPLTHLMSTIPMTSFL